MNKKEILATIVGSYENADIQKQQIYKYNKKKQVFTDEPWLFKVKVM